MTRDLCSADRGPDGQRPRFARKSPRAAIAAALVVLVSVAAPRPLGAEMSSDEYQTGEQRLSPDERDRQAQRIQQERELAEVIAREREALAERARREEQARLAARPLGVRLVESRCGVCHGPDYLHERRYGWLGWWSVVLRMQYVNGARFEAGERRVIVTHLARSQPAGSLLQVLEWAAACAALALLLAAGLRLRRGR
jgi:hypothetical protein